MRTFEMVNDLLGGCCDGRCPRNQSNPAEGWFKNKTHGMGKWQPGPSIPELRATIHKVRKNLGVMTKIYNQKKARNKAGSLGYGDFISIGFILFFSNANRRNKTYVEIICVVCVRCKF